MSADQVFARGVGYFGVTKLAILQIGGVCFDCMDGAVASWTITIEGRVRTDDGHSAGGRIGGCRCDLSARRSYRGGASCSNSRRRSLLWDIRGTSVAGCQCAP